MRYSSLSGVVTVLAVAAPVAMIAPLAYATDYMTVADAQKSMFPDATEFAVQAVAPTPAQAALVEKRAGLPLRTASLAVYAAKKNGTVLGYVITDAVIGKFQLINYAVAFAPDASIRDVEILSYREAHGGEVRTKAWRRQFVGKSAAAPLRVGDDIANISGATLSCTHLSDGIRVVAAYALVAWGPQR